MVRLKNAKRLDRATSSMIDNAYYMCKPPERAVSKVSKLPPMLQYIHHLFETQLSGSESVEGVLKQLRKLPWSKDAKVGDTVLAATFGIVEERFNGVDMACDILAGLRSYHDDVAVRAVDTVLERIQVGLEENDHRNSQRNVGMTTAGTCVD